MRPGNTINISDEILSVIHEISLCVPVFSHVDISRIFVCISSNRNGRGGTFGKLVPLRFKDGAQIMKYHQRFYSSPSILHKGVEMLYVIYFYLPKFFNLPSREKLKVIFHELYHINPAFNGDIRRMGEVKAAHGSSRKRFDENFTEELDEFYSKISGSPLMQFLTLDSHSLFSQFDEVLARRMKSPKPVLIR